jgi:formylmethanofuran dehydrogenase subunit E
METLRCDKCGEDVAVEDVKIAGDYHTLQDYCVYCYRSFIQYEYIKVMDEVRDA